MPTGLTSATRTARKTAICSQPCAIRGSPPAAARKRGRRRPGPRRSTRRGRRRRTMQAAARSYPVDQLDRPVEEGEGADGDGYREEIGRKTATAGENICERSHISIMRLATSRVCVQSRDDRGD